MNGVAGSQPSLRGILCQHASRFSAHTSHICFMKTSGGLSEYLALFLAIKSCAALTEFSTMAGVRNSLMWMMSPDNSNIQARRSHRDDGLYRISLPIRQIFDIGTPSVSAACFPGRTVVWGPAVTQMKDGKTPDSSLKR